ncbi:TIGR03084 family metal-binding protein [Actinotalea sp. M2MS4P-6]|uniref:TIGR03084 family metal-binding protein n=1 Tax=Actinotalea sp. M2MS4P-6 TaxID=2983762 RepID=UPI0021E47F27|nr:TIGR03084 family metal-binding protein [Actinotalea sp. M2MS4P-6]MCV2394279.1 TIGR03084 family metal-binding protein [Actinotalea sp. M2MS4P-6]
MERVVTDLIAEQAQVDTLVGELAEDQWSAPAATCDWTFKEELAHIAAYDWAAIELMKGNGESVNELADAHFGLDESYSATAYLDRTGTQLLDWWREVRCRLAVAFLDNDPKARVPWAAGAPPMSVRSLATARLMELWAHSVDLYDALGLEPLVTDRIAHTLFLTWQARPHAYRINGLELPDTPVRLELTLPSGAPWVRGPEDAVDRIVGTARDWALVGVRRRRWQDTDLAVTGDEARRYADVVQAFAGEAATPPARTPVA